MLTNGPILGQVAQNPSEFSKDEDCITPVGDLYQCLTSVIMTFFSSLTFLTFLLRSLLQLEFLFASFPLPGHLGGESGSVFSIIPLFR